MSTFAVAWAGKMLAKSELVLLRTRAAATGGKITKFLSTNKLQCSYLYQRSFIESVCVKRAKDSKKSRGQRFKEWKRQGLQIDISPESSQPEFLQ